MDLWMSIVINSGNLVINIFEPKTITIIQFGGTGGELG
jgi:hypothetical protein